MLKKFDRILVTGGSGFIGCHLVGKLVKGGFKVTVLDKLSADNLKNVMPDLNYANLHFVRGDVRDKQAVKEVLKDVKMVFHLAAISSLPFSVENPEITSEVNLNGTQNLLEASIRNNVEKFIYASTCAVYGDPTYLPVDEEHPTHPKSPYGETKLKAEQQCMKFVETHGLRTTILRLFNVYGLGQRRDEYGGVIARFVSQLRNNKSPTIYGDGSQTRDFVYVDDVIQAFMLTLNHGNNCDGQIFNIASGKPTPINELALLLIDLLGAKGIKPKYLKAREGEVKHIYADIKKAEKILNYKPKISIKEGLINLLDLETS